MISVQITDPYEPVQHPQLILPFFVFHPSPFYFYFLFLLVTKYFNYLSLLEMLLSLLFDRHIFKCGPF